MKNIHFIGIGGIGMSALADICIAGGDNVSGSDLRPNNLTERLKTKGADIYEGHSEGNVPADTDIAVRSTCIRDDNPEVIRAEELGVPVISRGNLLKDIMESKPSFFTIHSLDDFGNTFIFNRILSRDNDLL